MKNDFSFIPRMNKDGTFTSENVVKQGDEVYQKINEYCLTKVLKSPSDSSIPERDLQAMTAKDAKRRNAYLATCTGVSFDLSREIVGMLRQIPSGKVITPKRFQYLSELVYPQIASKERLLKQLIAQYHDVLVTAKHAGKKPASVRCSLLLNSNLILVPRLIDGNPRELTHTPRCEIFNNDMMLRYYLKRFKENIQQRALYKKHVMGYFWVKCHLKNQNSVYLHMNMYIDNKFEEINIIDMIRDIWENVTTETKPGERQIDKIGRTPRKLANLFYSPNPGGILFYTKNKDIPLNFISNDTTHDVAYSAGVNLAVHSGTNQVIPMLEDFDGTLSVAIKKVTEPGNAARFQAYLLHLAKTSCFLPWSDAFAASKITGSIKK